MRARAGLWSLVSLTVILATASVATAQYFGRNKVQYEDLHFRIYRTEHFDVYFYLREESTARLAGEMAERWYSRLSNILDHDLRGTQPLILYSCHPHFQQTNVISGLPSEGTGGVTESIKRRIVLPLAGPLSESDHVIGHELVHAFQYDLTAQNRAAAASSLRFPLWFMEGMAEYLSVGPVDTMTASWLREAAIEDDLPTLETLSDPRYFPYRFGQAFWAYIGGRYGDRTVGEILKAAAGGGDVIGAITKVLHQDEKKLSEDWQQSIREDYGSLLDSPLRAPDFGRALLTDEKSGGSLNVAPSLSPDGRQVVFLSERDLFSIDMYLADATTGEVEKKIVETATDPHFESLQFIRSSGSFRPDGKRFVFAALSEGQPVLTFLDPATGDVVNEIDFPTLGEIFNPAWSPDGKSIAFTAIRSGLLDLYVLDVASEKLDRLTNDEFAELHPTWSPDGGRIAFATDRFTSHPSTLSMGRYELATLALDSGDIEPLPAFGGTNHWDPHWTSKGLYFLADPDGRPNVYRLDPSGGGIYRVTSLSSGVHGITMLSPAITLSADGRRLLFTVRESDEYRVYAVDDEKVLRGSPHTSRAASRNWAVLPPVPRESSRIASWFDAPRRGLPEDKDFPEDPYEADLNLDYIGQPYVVGGTDRFGSFLGGGVSFLWSDMLGNHNLGTQVQLNGGVRDIAAVASYRNLGSRWNWGGTVSRIPFLSNRFVSTVAEVNGQVAQVEQLVQLRQTERRAMASVAYPFNRAERLELPSGFTNYSFSREADTRALSLETGQVLVDQNNVDLGAPSALNLGESRAAFVHDAAVLGPTSPLLGSRYRFEGGGSYGSLNFANVLVDYRHYFMPVRPFTFAVRGMHFGRYGGDSEDDRLTDLFLGYPNLVRGYQSGSFTADECRADGGCRVFQRLLGSRLAVANFEFRFPLLSLFGGEPWGGPLPIEVAFFGDAGVAWRSSSTPAVFGGDRGGVTSAGAALRVALQRYFTIELDLVRPFQRPQKGWMFEFNFKRGF